MSLFARLAGLVSKQRPMLSVSVSLRSGTYFVVTIHSCDGSEPCVSAGPVEALPLATSQEDLGNAIIRGLRRTTHNFPYPANKEQWAQITAPLLSAAGCKSWSAFAKLASDLRVNQTGEQIQVLPCIREKTSFAPVADREGQLKAPSTEEIGRVVATELEFAAKRDGAELSVGPDSLQRASPGSASS
jgi:hypothetical protein